MTSRRAGCPLRIEALVIARRTTQGIELAGAGDELPHSRGTLVRHGTGQEARLGLCEINEFLRNAFFFQNALDHRLVAATAAEAAEQGVTPRIRREVMYVGENRIGKLQRYAGGSIFHFA